MEGEIVIEIKGIGLAEFKTINFEKYDLDHKY